MLDTTSPMARMAKSLEKYVVLSPGDRDAILALPFKVTSYESGAYLVREGDRADKCALLMTGFAFRHKLTGAGTRQIIAIHVPGDLLDMQNLFLDYADHNVQMLSRSDVLTVSRSAFGALAKSAALIGHAVLLGVLVDASVYREWILNIGRRDARGRVAHLICEIAARLDMEGLPPGQDYELPMTQEQLADALGLTPVHVNRVLRILEDDGLILRKSRQIRLPHWEQLRRASDFDDRYLHQAQTKGISTAEGGLEWSGIEA